MTFKNERVSYVTEEDKAGPYLLPKAYVGASNEGFVFRSTGCPSKLRLDDSAHPQQVQLLDERAGGEAYSFARQTGS